MKQFVIDTASTTLTAIALVGTMCIASPAKADNNVESLLIALGTAIVFNEVYKDRTQHVGKVENVYGSQHNPLNERHRPGYAAGLNDANKVCHQEVIRHGNYAEVVESNCYGVVVNTKIIRR